jgi:hypothetical protein
VADHWRETSFFPGIFGWTNANLNQDNISKLRARENNMTPKNSILTGIVLVLFFALNAQGQTQYQAQTQSRPHYRSPQASSSDGLSRHNYISGAFGFLAPGANTLVGTVNGNQQVTSFQTSGLFALGGDYDYLINKDFSIGGILRYYNCSSSIAGQTVQDTLFALGPDVRAYLPSGNFLPYVGAGFIYMAPGVTVGNNSYSITSGLGLMLSMGILYNLTETIGLGVETTRLTGLSSSINGNLVEDYMLKGRFALSN